MKTLTLTQPWATLVAIGAKKIETRSWSTEYRGPLVIHSAKTFPAEAMALMVTQPFAMYLAGHKMPLGFVIATCELVDVVRIIQGVEIPLGGEWHFGDYTLGRYMWYLENVKMLPEPIQARGALGLWEWKQAEETK